MRSGSWTNISINSQSIIKGGKLPDKTSKQWRSGLLGIGGNVGDVRSNMRAALKLLGENENVRIMLVSSIYRTPPWGKKDQPAFLNICVEISTCLKPEKLLDLCHVVERVLKRERVVKWGPRTIDIDILFLGEVSCELTNLIIPHPRILARAFVLVPLAEIAPKRMLEGKTIDHWHSACDDSGISKIAEGRVFDDLLSSAPPQG
jgi:2-amino-4-hydroxy-6-hydroxymethyldihydropteridine diphosphokinase